MAKKKSLAKKASVAGDNGDLVSCSSMPFSDSCVVDDPANAMIMDTDFLSPPASGVEGNEHGGGGDIVVDNGTKSGEEWAKKRRRRKDDNWGPPAPDLLPGPKFCPSAITQYVSLGNKKPSESLVLDARQHLSFLGWKIDCAIYKPTGTCFRFRYSSPDDTKVYYSLRLLCRDLGNSIPSNSCLVSQDNPTIRKRKRNSDDSSQLPSIAGDLPNPERAEDIGTMRSLLVGSRSTRVLRSSKAAKKRIDHQIAEQKCLGRAIEIRGDVQDDAKGNGAWLACQELSTATATPTLKSSRVARGQIVESHSTAVIETTTEAGGDDPKGNQKPPACLELSTKKLTPIPSSRNPRTYLSWLIDNSVVSEGDKVHYRGKSSSPLAVGRITREGIKCDCCQAIFNLSAFEAHAGSTNHRPAANILLEDGRTLQDCQKQVAPCHVKVKSFRKKSGVQCKQARQHQGKGENDDICSVCYDGGDLILCDNCPSSYHKSCLGLADIPDEEWFCSSCRCPICGQIKSKEDVHGSSHARILSCDQCQRGYHVGCLKDKGVCELEEQKGNWFCNVKCEAIFIGLQKLLRRPIEVGQGGLRWTLVKSSETDTYDHSKLSAAIEVMHECFEPVKDAFTGRDIVEDLIYGRGSNLKRLNCNGFYAVLLERYDKLITVATLRIWGHKVAEVPLVGTRFQYRRLGMCRILMDELEKQLVNLGVERLVLPSATSTLGTWVNGFGFAELTESDLKQFADLTFVNFHDTIMCQKVLESNPMGRAEVVDELIKRS